VAACVSVAIKGARDITIGNVIESDLLSTLSCVRTAGLATDFEGLAVGPAVMTFDIRVMLADALACLPMFIRRREITCWKGSLFLG